MWARRRKNLEHTTERKTLMHKWHTRSIGTIDRVRLKEYFHSSRMSTRVWKDNARNFVEVADSCCDLHLEMWNSSGSVGGAQCIRFQRFLENRDYQHSQGEVGQLGQAKQTSAQLALE